MLQKNFIPKEKIKITNAQLIDNIVKKIKNFKVQ